MIELTDKQVQALETSAPMPTHVLNPQTGEAFVLLRKDEYERLIGDYDDSPWTREERQALAWERIKDEDWSEYDHLGDDA